MYAIRAGTIEECHPSAGDWAFVDPGFSAKAKSCGLLVQSGQPELLTFGELSARLAALVATGDVPLNLVIEAPLSVAFGPAGNPVGRSIERRDRSSRYWYVGLGCSVLVSATYLVRAISEAGLAREVRLFEGFVSFKQQGVRSNHCADVVSLRRVVEGDTTIGRIVSPVSLATSPDHRVVSAFAVGGMNYGVPPVVAVGG